jgi:hypothetical protein
VADDVGPVGFDLLRVVYTAVYFRLPDGRLQKITDREKTVLVNHAFHVNADSGLSWPGAALSAAETALTKRGVLKIRARLEAVGVLVPEDGVEQKAWTRKGKRGKAWTAGRRARRYRIDTAVLTNVLPFRSGERGAPQESAVAVHPVHRYADGSHEQTQNFVAVNGVTGDGVAVNRVRASGERGDTIEQIENSNQEQREDHRAARGAVLSPSMQKTLAEQEKTLAGQERAHRSLVEAVQEEREKERRRRAAFFAEQRRARA